jgi:hypothetical protein
MNEKQKSLVVVCVTLAWMAGIVIGAFGNQSLSQQEAVKHGAGRYNPQTGYFEWLDEVTK